MNAGVTSERVYDALKARLLSGDVLPGERLEPSAYAEALGSSVTPVRDALHRLAGEHIVEMRPAEGFQLPFVTELALRDLLGWNGTLLRLALRQWSGSGPGPRSALPQDTEPAAEDYAGGIRSLFGVIAARSGHAEFARHIAAASDRLAAARIAESKILPDPAGDLGDLAAVMAGGEALSVARSIAAYHRHRIHLVPVIVQAIYRS